MFLEKFPWIMLLIVHAVYKGHTPDLEKKCTKKLLFAKPVLGGYFHE
jgi:hypothetical protein